MLVAHIAVSWARSHYQSASAGEVDRLAARSHNDSHLQFDRLSSSQLSHRVHSVATQTDMDAHQISDIRIVGSLIVASEVYVSFAGSKYHMQESCSGLRDRNKRYPLRVLAPCRICASDSK